MKLTPVPVARLLGGLLLLQGAVLVLFWKILDFALVVGMERYSSTTGRLAQSLFKSDRQLVELLQFGQDWVPCVLVLGIVAIVPGILTIAFPLQSVQLLHAVRLLRRAKD